MFRSTGGMLQRIGQTTFLPKKSALIVELPYIARSCKPTW
jgi:hypothetical protein